VGTGVGTIINSLKTIKHRPHADRGSQQRGRRGSLRRQPLASGAGALALNLVKTGTGTLRLTNNNTFAGTLTLTGGNIVYNTTEGGTLQVDGDNGRLSGVTGAIAINNGSRLVLGSTATPTSTRPWASASTASTTRRRSPSRTAPLLRVERAQRVTATAGATTTNSEITGVMTFTSGFTR